jgi:hypothetical protein
MLLDLYVLVTSPQSTVLTMLVVFTLSVLLVACVPTLSRSLATLAPSGASFALSLPWGMYLFRSLSLLVSFIPVFWSLYL